MIKPNLAALLTAVLLALSLISTTPVAHAGTYQGYAAFGDPLGNVWQVWVTVDTDRDTVTIRWDGPYVTWFGVGGITEISAGDDKGWSHHTPGSYSGSITINGYTNTYTKLSVTVAWVYKAWIFPFPYIKVPVTAYVNVGG